jgi:hypothetical protein
VTEHPAAASRRQPWLVPDDEPLDAHDGGEFQASAGLDVSAGFDTDGDGRSDTAVTDDGADLVLLTDLDGDGLADQILRIGRDGVVRQQAAPHPGHTTGILDGLCSGAEVGYES